MDYPGQDIPLGGPGRRRDQCLGQALGRITSWMEEDEGSDGGRAAAHLASPAAHRRGCAGMQAWAGRRRTWF